MLVDVFSKGLTGKVAEAALGRAAITVNKNAIPVRHQPADGRQRHPPRHAGGDHARHAAPPRWRVIAALIARVLAAPDDAAVAAAVKAEVEQLCQTFPLYRTPSASSTR